MSITKAMDSRTKTPVPGHTVAPPLRGQNKGLGHGPPFFQKRNFGFGLQIQKIIDYNNYSMLHFKIPFFSVFRTIPTYISSKRNRKKSFRSFFWYSGDYKNIVTPFNTRNHERNSSFLNGDVKFNFCSQWTKKVPIESADDGDDDSIVWFFLETFVSSEIWSKVKNDFLCTDEQSLVHTAS